MKLTLSHFLTTDKLRLPGLLYEPEKQSDAVAVFLHGCGSSSVFYKSEMNLWGKLFTEKGISFFPFNNRGAHYIKSLKRVTDDGEERVVTGTYFELIKDSIQDIDGALKYLKNKGYNTFYLIGHSTGANKICVYNYYKKQNPIAKYILLAGGDDTGLNYEMLGNDRFKKALMRSREEVEKGNGTSQVPQSLFPEPYSYQSLHDVLNPDGDYNSFPFYEYLNDVKLSTKPLFREFQSINKPLLVVYGDQDEYCYGNVKGCIEALKAYSTNLQATTYHLLPGANHGFDGNEQEIGNVMVEWLLNTT